MKPNSDLFSKIRIDRGRASKTPTTAVARHLCQSPGCRAEGTHRAPKGRHAEGEYLWLCLDHVRDYNKTFNYFSGMNDAAIQAYQKDATIGHRPTWRMGVGAKPGETPPIGGRTKYGWDGARDTFQMFGEGFSTRQAEPERRSVRNMELKSLQALGLEAGAARETIKARYKLLVKKHHPDANGGDRSSEDRLREIIGAYSYLKSVGFC